MPHPQIYWARLTELQQLVGNLRVELGFGFEFETQTLKFSSSQWIPAPRWQALQSMGGCKIRFQKKNSNPKIQAHLNGLQQLAGSQLGVKGFYGV